MHMKIIEIKIVNVMIKQKYKSTILKVIPACDMKILGDEGNNKS